MQDKKRVALLWQPKDQINDYYKKALKDLLDIVET